MGVLRPLAVPTAHAGARHQCRGGVAPCPEMGPARHAQIGSRGLRAVCHRQSGSACGPRLEAARGVPLYLLWPRGRAVAGPPRTAGAAAAYIRRRAAENAARRGFAASTVDTERSAPYLPSVAPVSSVLPACVTAEALPA